jgi:hypothetical protein
MITTGDDCYFNFMIDVTIQ